MLTPTTTSIIGLLYLIFRLWLDEIKLAKELDFRRRYLSRFANYFFAIALIYNLQNMVFNMIVITSMPAIWVAFLRWDIRFYKRFKKGISVSSIPLETKAQRVWMIIERLTLHPPMLAFGTIPFFTGLRKFALGSASSSDLGGQILTIFYAMILFFSAFFFMDVRWYKRHRWPTGKIILYALIGSCILIFPFILIPTFIEIL
ncbi:MAG: hypothetical protein ACTSUK_09590 [Promethearchaeota archaeon]